ncbi:hypothetical protein [Roseateles sp. P5_E7]
MKNQAGLHRLSMQPPKGAAHMGIVQLVEVPGSPEGSLGLALPEDVLARLRLAEGDTVLLTETPHGIRLTPAQPSPDDTPLHNTPQC